MTDDDVARNARSVSSPEAAGRWQPIETAPKDGTVVLLAAHDIHGHSDPGGPRQVVRSAYWAATFRAGRGDWSASAFTTHFPPTHWMRLPEPPAARNASEDTQRSDSEATTDDPAVQSITVEGGAFEGLFPHGGEVGCVFGEYTGEDCPNCGRMRLMNCEDDSGRARVICEKCEWEPAEGKYRGEVGCVFGTPPSDPKPTTDDVDALVKAADALVNHPDWGTWPYMEGGYVYRDASLVRTALQPFQKG